MMRFILLVIALFWSCVSAWAGFFASGKTGFSTASGPYTATNRFSIAAYPTSMVNVPGGTITTTASGQYRDGALGVCNITTPQSFPFSPNALPQWLVGDTQANGCGAETGGNPRCNPGTGNPFCVVASLVRPANAIASLYNPGFQQQTEQCLTFGDGVTTEFYALGGTATATGRGCPGNGDFFPFLSLMPVPGTVMVCATVSGARECHSDATSAAIVPCPTGASCTYGSTVVGAALPTPLRITDGVETNGSNIMTMGSTAGIAVGNYITAASAAGGNVNTVSDVGHFVRSVGPGAQITMGGVGGGASNCVVCSPTTIKVGFNYGAFSIPGGGNFAGAGIIIQDVQNRADGVQQSHQGAYYLNFTTAPDAGTAVTLTYKYGWAPHSTTGSVTATNNYPAYDTNAMYGVWSLLQSVDEPNGLRVAEIPVAGSLPGSGIAYLDPAVPYSTPTGQVFAQPCQNMGLNCSSASSSNRNTSADGGPGPYFNSGVTCTPGTAGQAGWQAGGTWSWTASTHLFTPSTIGTTVCGLDLATASGSWSVSGPSGASTKIYNSKIDQTVNESSRAGIAGNQSGIVAQFNEVFGSPTLSISSLTSSQPCLSISSSTNGLTGINISNNYLHDCPNDVIDLAGVGTSSGDQPVVSNNVMRFPGWATGAHNDGIQTQGTNGQVYNLLFSNNYDDVRGFYQSPAAFPDYSNYPKNQIDSNSHTYLEAADAAASCSAAVLSAVVTNNYLNGSKGLQASPGIGCGTAALYTAFQNNSFTGHITAGPGSQLIIDTVATVGTTVTNTTPLTFNGGVIPGANLVTAGTVTLSPGTTINLSADYPSPITTRQMIPGAPVADITLSGNILGHSITNAPPLEQNVVAPHWFWIATETGNYAADSGHKWASGTPY